MFSFFRRSPLVIICLFFIAGILFEFDTPISNQSVLHLAVALSIISLWLIIAKKSPQVQTILLCGIALCLGGLTTSNFIYQSTIFQDKVIQSEFYINKKLRANQYIASTNEMQFLLEGINNDTLQSGDKLIATGEFSEIQPPKLPWLFNQKKQMLSIGITLQFKPSKIIELSSSARSSIQFLPQHIQKKLQQKIFTAIPDTADAAILSALLLGETSLLSKEITSDYSIAGVVHILAVSGMHVALIYELILFLLKTFFRKRRKWLTFVLAMTLLWSYGAITGFSASVVRACCMFSFFVLSDCFLLPRKTANTIAGSTLLILFFQPYLIFNLGFLLSLTAVLGIVVIHPIFIKACYTENKIAYSIFTSSSITLSAQIATLPITLYIFHSFPTYFIAANLILVPWSSLILYLGITFIFTSTIPLFGTLITTLLKFTTASMNAFIHLIHYLPFSQLTEINFNFEQAIICYFTLISLLIFFFYRWKMTIHFTGILSLAFLYYSYKNPILFAEVFTYYQSNILIVGTEKELLLACNNDSIGKKYISKINLWKCQQNRSSQQIANIPFPNYLLWKENNIESSIATYRNKEKSNCVLLNEEMRNNTINSSTIEGLENKKILIGKGLSRKKRESLEELFVQKNIPFQNTQTLPFKLK